MTKTSSVKTSAVLRVYWQHLRPYQFLWYVHAFSIAAAEVAASVALPWVFKRFIDVLSSPGANSADAGAALFYLLLLIGVCRLIGWVGYRVGNLTVQFLTSHVMADLSTSSLRYLLRHSFAFFTDTFAGSLVRRINRLSQSFDQLSDALVFQFIPLVLTVAGVIVVIFLRSPVIGFVVLAWIVVFMVVDYRVAVWRLKYNEARAEKDSAATGVLSDIIGNALTVKLFSGYREEDRRYGEATEDLRRARKRSWNIAEYCEAIEYFLMISIELIVMVIAIHLWQQGALTVGDFVLFQGYLLAIIGRLSSFRHMLRTIFESFADAKEMVEILDAPHEIQDKPRARTLNVPKGEIRFVDVTFNYNQTRQVLSGFNLAIAPHERVALVGSSGAGKSTVTKLLFRFFDVDGGKILIDGQNIADVKQDSLRDAIALVPQEPILFHRTLMENIRYGQSKATDKEVIRAAKLARCHEFIQEMPDGYDTYVGERGVKLSGGERQRVAIARAILKDAPILVLDEATSSLDSESESLIQDALRVLMKNKTVIVIAHRLSTIMQMDRIIVMEDGKVTDMGTHDQLLKKTGVYRKLWNIQAGGFGGVAGS